MPAGARDVRALDDELPGFGIREDANGHAVYVKYRIGPKQRRLGRAVRGNPRGMRALASAVLAKARLSIDVVGEQEKTKREAAQTVTLGELVLV